MNPSDPIQAGKRVVELAALSKSTVLFTSAVVAASATWIAKHSWLRFP